MGLSEEGNILESCTQTKQACSLNHSPLYKEQKHSIILQNNTETSNVGTQAGIYCLLCNNKKCTNYTTLAMTPAFGKQGCIQREGGAWPREFTLNYTTLAMTLAFGTEGGRGVAPGIHPELSSPPNEILLLHTSNDQMCYMSV